eukprot:TRINITY_DN4198_c0_g1_i1.p1 TRINITY_DN4198_c0_g1~~TRINITY_DN4198_c0_g1_i1.p1  ORF type:complete len:155 (+),score=20.81 TRINITY_DN4198_c0_g1_i1:676-1140(+)
MVTIHHNGKYDNPFSFILNLKVNPVPDISLSPVSITIEMRENDPEKVRSIFLVNNKTGQSTTIQQGANPHQQVIVTGWPNTNIEPGENKSLTMTFKPPTNPNGYSGHFRVGLGPNIGENTFTNSISFQVKHIEPSIWVNPKSILITFPLEQQAG